MRVPVSDAMLHGRSRSRFLTRVTETHLSRRFRPSASALHLALCKEHDRLNSNLQLVKAKWLSLMSNSGGSVLSEEETRVARAFSANMPVTLPKAFKLKSDSDKSFRTPSKEISPPSTLSRRQTFLKTATSKSFVASKASIEPDPVSEEEQELQITSGDREARSNTISLDNWVKANPEQGSSRKNSSGSGSNSNGQRVASLNPLTADIPKKSAGKKVQAALSRTLTKMER